MSSNPVLYHKTLVSIINMLIFFHVKLPICLCDLSPRHAAVLTDRLTWPWFLFPGVSYFPLICVEKSKNCVSRMETSNSSYYLLLHTIIGLIGTKVSFSESTMLSSTCASTRVEIVSFVRMYFNSALSVFSLSDANGFQTGFTKKMVVLVICLNVTALVYSFLMSNLLCEQCLSLLSSII